MNVWQRGLKRLRRRACVIVFHSDYRIPLVSLEGPGSSLETRRAQNALQYLLHARAISNWQTPIPVAYDAIERVHDAAYVESLQVPATLAHIFAVGERDFVVDELLRTIRLACGGTMLATRQTLATGSPVLNLLGGFHHAAPTRGSGFCALNDIAIAIAQLRSEGFNGRIGVLDVDFHPPDGTSACLLNDPHVWIGSISGTEWGALPNVDETVLPHGTGDDAYAEALGRLLTRMPTCELVFVVAGGDVLTTDVIGHFDLSMQGIRRRDLLIARTLNEVPQVWLPAGGYSAQAWQVLAGTGLAIAFRSSEAIERSYDPTSASLNRIARSLEPESLGNSPLLTSEDVADLFGGRVSRNVKLLDYYSREGVEYALERYGILPLIRRLGFEQLTVSIERFGKTDRAVLRGRDVTTAATVTLIELEVEKRSTPHGSFLFVNWLSLRNPRAVFSSTRPKLPGQEVPGLGLSREMSELLGLVATRLELDGVSFCPSWYHMAFAARHTARFIDAARQGRFEAMVRDLRDMPLLEATRAVADGRVQLNGAPYRWEADDMVAYRDPSKRPEDGAQVKAVRDASHFAVTPKTPPAPRPL